MPDALLELPTRLSVKWFEVQGYWIEKLQQQVTTALIEKESPVTLDLNYYLIERLAAHNQGGRCCISFDEFAEYAKKHSGTNRNDCAHAWMHFDWNVAITSPYE